LSAYLDGLIGSGDERVGTKEKKEKKKAKKSSEEDHDEL